MRSPPRAAGWTSAPTASRSRRADARLVVYSKPLWRDSGRSGHARSLIGPASGFFDISPADGPGILVAFCEGSHARAVARLSPDERRAAILDGLSRLFGNQMLRPTAYHEHDMSAVSFIRGCYAAYFGPGVWTSFGSSLRQAEGRIHWAGSETALEFYGFMEGAVRSGERAAADVLAQLH